MKHLVSILFWIICSSVWSQTQYVANLFSKDSLRFFIISNNLQLIFNNSIVTKKGDLFVKSDLYIDQFESFDSELNWNNFEFVNNDQNSYLVRRNLGEVFLIENDSLKRIDRSSNLLSNSGSIKTIYNDKIYSFFGYGWFESTNLSVGFDMQSFEWNKIFHPLSSEIPSPRRSPFHCRVADQLYFFNGVNKTVVQNDGFVFDFKTNEYKMLGKVEDSFPFKHSSPFNFTSLNQYKKLYQLEEILLLIDFQKLSYSITDNLNAIDLNFSGGHQVGDKIYFLKALNNTEFYLESVDTNFIENSFTEFHPIFKTSFFNRTNAAFLFIVIALLSLLILIYKILKLRKLKRVKILKQGNYLTLNGELIILSLSEAELIDHLILNPLSSMGELYNLFFLSEYTDYYKKQVLSKTLDELINKLNESQNIRKFISISKIPNPKDKRAIDVILKGEIIIYKGWLNYLFTV